VQVRDEIGFDKWLRYFQNGGLEEIFSGAAEVSGEDKSAKKQKKSAASAVVDPKVDIVLIEDDDTFASHHLADILNSAFSSKKDLKDKLLAMQSKHEVFKGVKRSKKEKDATGASKDVSFTNMQICEKISKCRPDAVETAAELLSWLKVSAIKCDAAGIDVLLCVEYELEF